MCAYKQNVRLQWGLIFLGDLLSREYMGAIIIISENTGPSPTINYETIAFKGEGTGELTFLPGVSS